MKKEYSKKYLRKLIQKIKFYNINEITEKINNNNIYQINFNFWHTITKVNPYYKPSIGETNPLCFEKYLYIDIHYEDCKIFFYNKNNILLKFPNNIGITFKLEDDFNIILKKMINIS